MVQRLAGDGVGDIGHDLGLLERADRGDVGHTGVIGRLLAGHHVRRGYRARRAPAAGTLMGRFVATKIALAARRGL